MNSPARSKARSAARLAAVQALYQQHMEGTVLTKLLDEFHQHRLGRTIDDDAFDDAEYADAEVPFFDDIVRGVDARRAEIDDILTGKLAAGWSLTRLDKAMLQVLRAGTYELLARADVDRVHAVGNARFLEHDVDLVPVGRRPGVEVDHGGSL